MIKKVYQKLFIKRYDREAHLQYFTHADFPGLRKQEISFPAAQGQLLRGGLYDYEGYDGQSLVIFCHGIGGGHLSYMREIELLCKNRFQVLAYDNTGCDASEGASIRGMAQSLADLDACMEFLSREQRFAGKRIFVVGHSWGGYAAGNILGYRDTVEKAVVISGFVSVELLMRQYFKGVLRTFLPSVMRYERRQNPRFADSSSADAYRKSTAELLVIHSEEDPMVPMAAGAGYLQNTLTEKQPHYLIVQEKRHNPNYTRDAVAYMNERFGALQTAIRQKKLPTVEDKKAFMADTDWWRMTAQDGAVWREVIAFLDPAHLTDGQVSV